MNRLWVPPQAERYTKDDLLAAARKMGCHDVKPRTIRTFIESGLLDHPHRQPGGRGGGALAGWWPRVQFDLWCALLNQRKGLIARREHRNRVHIVLCNVVVAAWLYFGEASGIPLTQVRRAMRTWVNAHTTVRSFEEAQRLAKRFVRLIAHPSARNRLELQKYIADILFTGRYPDPDVLLYQVGSLIDPMNRGEIKGPAEAPIAAQNITDMILGRVEAQAMLRKNDTQTPDGLWEWTRVMLLYSRNRYQVSQPRIREDPSFKKYPELRHLYEPETFETMVNTACEDLLTTLGTLALAQQATHLPPPLHPDPWLAGEMHVRVESHQHLSDVFQPDGSRQAYLGISVQVTQQSDS